MTNHDGFCLLFHNTAPATATLKAPKTPTPCTGAPLTAKIVFCVLALVDAVVFTVPVSPAVIVTALNAISVLYNITASKAGTA